MEAPYTLVRLLFKSILSAFALVKDAFSLTVSMGKWRITISSLFLGSVFALVALVVFPRLYGADFIWSTGVAVTAIFVAAFAPYIVKCLFRTRVKSLLMRLLGSKESSESILTETYFAKGAFGYASAVGLLVVVSAMAGWDGQVGISISALSVAAALVGHVTVTKYRIDRGLFGENIYEASELINFVIAQRKRSEPPPGSKVGKAEFSKDSAEPLTTAVEGATT